MAWWGPAYAVELSVEDDEVPSWYGRRCHIVKVAGTAAPPRDFDVDFHCRGRPDTRRAGHGGFVVAHPTPIAAAR